MTKTKRRLLRALFGITFGFVLSADDSKIRPTAPVGRRDAGAEPRDQNEPAKSQPAPVKREDAPPYRQYDR
jgi:hypothetical protein